MVTQEGLEPSSREALRSERSAFTKFHHRAMVQAVGIEPTVSETGGLQPPCPPWADLHGASARNRTPASTVRRERATTSTTKAWSARRESNPLRLVGSQKCNRQHFGRMERYEGDDPSASCLASRCSTNVS